MPPFDPTDFGPAVAGLLRRSGLATLTFGRPDAAARPLLEALTDADLAAPHPLRDPAAAAACRAGLWLYFDFFEESHGISQELKTPEGSYWHAILHRREPDHANAAYWFRRVGLHPVFEPLRQAAAALAATAPPPGAFLARQARWDPFAFNDLCEASTAAAAPCHDLCRRVQRAEWELLFAYCHARAAGDSAAR
jgi:hypothetical protein